MGRAGRGTLPGEAVIQTYQPDHYAVTYAAAQDYEGFFEEELLYREMGGYPPVQHLLAVQVFAKAEEKGDQYVKKLVSMAKEWLSEKGKQSDSDPRAVILGPSPAVITKINDIFRFVFYVKCKKYDTLVFCKDYLEDQIRILGEQAVTVQFDFDPMSTM